jgi:hypothetical protein
VTAYAVTSETTYSRHRIKNLILNPSLLCQILSSPVSEHDDAPVAAAVKMAVTTIKGSVIFLVLLSF